MAGVLVHEWIERSGGAEKVLDEFVHCYPDADLYCLWNDAPDRYPAAIVRESILARTPLRGRKALALPAMPFTWRGLENRDYDFALISSHLFAHHATFAGGSAELRKFVYVHTPARYVWNPELDERGNSLPARLASPFLRKVDRKRASEGASFAANSEFVSSRIERAWGVQSKVIYPPVDVVRIAGVADWRSRLTQEESQLLSSLPSSFVLGASRFIPYKRLDWVIKAAEKAGIAAVVAGSGPEEKRLRAMASAASVPVRILHRPSDAMLFALYQQALAYVFPPIEDFGIMPVEAMAAGARLITNSVGGASETVVQGVDGLHFHDDRWESIAECILNIDSVNTARSNNYDKYSVGRFHAEIATWTGIEAATYVNSVEPQ
ncbi:glycosyl transferase [Rhodococcus sp. SRB_17]|uniref:glycosyltransferase n=1 Tax=Rhodococcus sp. OK302 TaxID=1882769 RepID=UPI000B941640|nr:glycosyltransferase [Rhodococcus sp. OK302]NMM83560.1 glycosyl transferase [Rhodococcus sp. SRB_17]OYD71662.1 glycosyltransferase involved in cell wall bisynthesis [Rhodococcus sp. OK302]